MEKNKTSKIVKATRCCQLFLVVVVIVVSGFWGMISMDLGSRSVKAVGETLTEHSPIYINGNDDFAAQAVNEGWPGNGTEGNRYRIENYDITANSAHGIHIENTYVCFTIKNCNIHDGGNTHDGIILKNVKRGKIENCDITNNYNGIHLSTPNIGGAATTENIIENCFICYNQAAGIRGSGKYNYPAHNRISDCIINYNKDGVVFQPDGKSNVIENCDISHNSEYAIYLFCPALGAAFNEFKSCNIADNGYIFGGAGYLNFYHHNNFINNNGTIPEEIVYFSFNYWSDYTGEDNNGDGIGDTPAEYDDFPLMDPVNRSAPDTRTPDIARVGLTVLDLKTFLVTAIVADNHALNNVQLHYSVEDVPYQEISMTAYKDPESPNWSPWEYTAEIYCSYDAKISYYIEAEDVYALKKVTTIYKTRAKLVGDITGLNGVPDGKVDTRDVGLVIRHFGHTVSKCPIDSVECDTCDIVRDGRVNIRDAAIIASNFGNKA